MTSCPGAESCKLAVTQSRGLGQAVEQHLRGTPALIDMARTLDINGKPAVALSNAFGFGGHNAVLCLEVA